MVAPNLCLTLLRPLLTWASPDGSACSAQEIGLFFLAGDWNKLGSKLKSLGPPSFLNFLS